MFDDEPRAEGRLAASAERLRREFDRWLDMAAAQGERALDAIGLRGGRPWTPAADIIEVEEAILVNIELPGVLPANLDVSLAGNMLTVKGTGRPTPTKEGQTIHLAECRHGDFSRSIPLPASADPEQIAAEFAEGILKLRIAKLTAAQPRQIVVTSPRSEIGAVS